MNVTLYKFTKRHNSTAMPKPSEGKAVSCQLKDETSFLNPVLILSKDIVSGVFSPDSFNYVMIPYWSRYYYITDWKYINGAWEGICTVDPMASFKGEIGNTTAYVVRSAYTYDGNITDTFYPATTQVNITKHKIEGTIYGTYVSDGCYIVGIINNMTTTRIGAVSYYALSQAELQSLITYLFSSNIYNNSNITEIGEGLYKSLFDPFQYIVSCMWFPLPPSTMGSTQANIRVGYWDTGVTGYIANRLVREWGIKTDVPIPSHPQASRGEYLNHAPFTRLTAYIAPFGEIPVDTMFMQYGNNNYLYGKIYCDCINGMADLYLSVTDGYGDQADPLKFFTMRSAQMGVPIQLSQVMSDYISTIGGGIGAFFSGATGNIGGIFNSITSAVQSAMPKVSSLGANGAFVELAEPSYLVIEHYRCVNADREEFGRPLCQKKKLSSIPGYIQCGEDDHAFSCTKQEQEEINSHLKNGFFYE